MPANSGMVFYHFAKIAAFDYLDISDTVDSILDLYQTDPVNNKLETMGFVSSQFINNVGTFFFFIAICVLGVVAWFLASLLSFLSQRAQRLRNKLSSMLFWNRLN